jgi:hypothetical protein
MSPNDDPEFLEWEFLTVEPAVSLQAAKQVVGCESPAAIMPTFLSTGSSPK